MVSIVAEDRKNSKEKMKKVVVMKAKIRELDQLILIFSVTSSALD